MQDLEDRLRIRSILDSSAMLGILKQSCGARQRMQMRLQPPSRHQKEDYDARWLPIECIKIDPLLGSSQSGQ